MCDCNPDGSSIDEKELCMDHLRTELEQVKAERAEALAKNEKYLSSMENFNKQLREVVELYLQHCGNNHQICGLNNRARELTAGKGNK